MNLTVGEISKVLGISADSIRYYVKEGLIKPTKNVANNYWEYSSDDVLLISDIMFYREMNLSINEIRRILNGADISKIEDIIDGAEKDARKKADEYLKIAYELQDWKKELGKEQSMIGRFEISQMPTELRKSDFYNEEDHIAHYLEKNLNISREDWAVVSLSFLVDLNEKPWRLQRYFSVQESRQVAGRNIGSDVIAERHSKCLKTAVHYTDDPEAMIAPLVEYASKNGYNLEGTVYGRERTNYFTDNKRGGLYFLYAPVK